MKYKVILSEYKGSTQLDRFMPHVTLIGFYNTKAEANKAKKKYERENEGSVMYDNMGHSVESYEVKIYKINDMRHH